MEDDLFTYEGKVANIPCNLNMYDDTELRMSQEADDDIGYDPSDVAFTEWLGLNFFNYKTKGQYTKKALWIYWIRGDDEVKLIDEEFFDNEDDVAEVFKIDTNIFNFETPMCKAFNEFNHLLQIDLDLLTKDIIGFKTYEDYKDGWIYEWKKNVPWVCDKPWLDSGIWNEPTPVKHINLEWYETLEDRDLKEHALRNKAIMEGSISDDDSNNDSWKRWRSHEITYHDHDEIEYENETHDKRQELYEEYVAVEEDEYDDLARRSNDAYRTYQEIFLRMDEGWMVTRAE
nr:hypothetical protein [Tanacetum cinerariifolium]